jgi:hypothetical protein
VLHIAGGEPPAAPPQFDDLLFWFYFFRLERVGGVSESKKKSNENKVESE